MLEPARIRYHYESSRYQGLYVHRISKKHTHARSAQLLLAQRRSAAPCGARAVPCLAVRCSAVQCCAVRCRALLCFLSYIPDDNASKQTKLARASVSLSILYSIVEAYVSILCFWIFSLYCTGYSSSSMYAYVVVGYLRQYHEHSTAQRNHHCTKQQTEYVRIRVHI